MINRTSSWSIVILWVVLSLIAPTSVTRAYYERLDPPLPNTKRISLPTILKGADFSEGLAHGMTVEKAAENPVCALYPIALHKDRLAGVAPGSEIRDIFNGDQPGNFGWLSWSGETDMEFLLASLTPPGDSGTYTNPDDPGDRLISRGDRIWGSPGVANAEEIRNALDTLKTLDIIVPVWDRSEKSGANALYTIVDYASVRLRSYLLPGTDRISVRFLGYASCEAPIAAGEGYGVNEDETLSVTAPGVLANDTDPDGDALNAVLVNGPDHATLELDADGSFRYTPHANYFGADQFTYRTDDGVMVSDVVTAVITISPVNDAPVVVSDDYRVEEDETLIVVNPGVLDNDSDVEGDSFVAQLATGPTHGTIDLKADGSFIYTPTSNFNGTERFTYTADDGDLRSLAATVTIAVLAVNDPPFAVDDEYGVYEDETLHVDVAGSVLNGVLDNDDDVDGDALMAILVNGPTDGELTLALDGSFSYTPTANFNGSDGFTYRAWDDSLLSGIATASIAISATNDAPVNNVPGAQIGDEDTTLLFANDNAITVSDVDAGSHAVEITLTAVKGRITLSTTNGLSFRSGNGILDHSMVFSGTIAAINTALSGLRFVPDENANGDAGLTITTNDQGYTGDGGTQIDSDTVAITLNSVNDAPSISSQSFAIDENNSSGTVIGTVLASDVDAGDTLTYTIIAGNVDNAFALHSSSGQLSIYNSGALDYETQPSFNLTIQVEDGAGASDTATITIDLNDVNDAPTSISLSGSSSVDENSTAGTIVGIFSSSDQDSGDSHTYRLVNGAGDDDNASFAIEGSSLKTSVLLDYESKQSYMIRVETNDGNGGTYSRSFTIHVIDVNEWPTIGDHSFSVDENSPVGSVVGTVSASDPDAGDSLTFGIQGGNTNGAFAIHSSTGEISVYNSGALDYEVHPSFSLMIQVDDKAGLTNVATVTIELNDVNEAPIAADDTATTNEDTPVVIDLLANDTDGEGDALTALVVTSPGHGTLAEKADGSLTYTPTADFNGTDAFTYKAHDGDLDSNIATVTITVVPINDAPVAADDSYSTDEDRALQIEAAEGLLVNDADAEGDSLTVTLGDLPVHGVLHLSVDGSFHYTPTAEYHGTDSFTYRAHDGSVGSNLATVAISIRAVADAPTAADDSYQVNEDETLHISSPGVLTNDGDVDGDVLTVALVDGTLHGTLAIEADGSLTYTPTANFSGVDQFTYRARDDMLESGTATVSFTVVAVNDPPLAGNDLYSVLEGETLVVDAPGVLANDGDVEGDALAAVLIGGPDHGLLHLALDGSFTYTPTMGFSGGDGFTYEVSDGVGSSTATVSITVKAKPAGPPTEPSAQGVIAGEVYNDATGLPIAGAAVELLSLDGAGPASPVTVASDGRGRFLVVSHPGLARLRITRIGFTAVERTVAVVGGRIVRPLDTRLTPLDGNAVLITSLLGGSVSDSGGNATLFVPPFALAGDQQMALSWIGGQGLAGRLPLGWSPLAAIDLLPHDLSFAEAATLSVPLSAGLPADGTIVAVRWDAELGVWIALGNPGSSTDGTSLQLHLMETGQVAFLLADPVPHVPSAPNPGEPISGAEAMSLPETLTATIEPSPRILFARPDARSQVGLQISAEQTLQSGVAVQIDLDDRYDFFSGALLVPDPMVQDFIVYAYPVGPDSVQADFAVSPSRPFDPYALRLGTIDVEARRPVTLETPIGVVLPPSGGWVMATSGATVTISDNASPTDLPVLLSPLTEAQIPLDLTGPLSFLGGVTLDLHGAPLNDLATLAIPAPAGLTAGDQVLVVQLVEANGASHLELVAVGVLQDDQLATTVDPLADGTLLLPGIQGEGRYLFLRATVPLGYVTGIATDSNHQPLARALVTVDTLSIVSISDEYGRFTLAAPLGAMNVTTVDPTTQDALVQSGQLAAKNEVLPLDFSLVAAAPAVLAVNPAHNAEGVSSLSTIRVTLSKVIDRASVTPAVLTLSDELGAVPGALSLLPGDRVLAFQPQVPLRSDAVYTVAVSTTIQDLNGRALNAPFVSRFSTEDTTPPLPPAAGALAAAIPDAEGYSAVTGSQGTAEPEWIVSIRNLATRALTTVLPESDGSFSARVPALRSDKLELILRDKAGNETRVPLPRFRDADGSVVVGNEGGIVEGEGGVFVEVAAGALPDGTIVKVTPATLADFGTLEPPSDLPFAGALKLDLNGAVPNRYLDIGIPAPADATITDTVLVARAVQVAGKDAWSLVDRAYLENGRYVTASPPFPGVLSTATFAFFKTTNIISAGPNGVLDTVPLRPGSDDMYAMRPVIGQVIVAGDDRILHTKPTGDDELRPECVSFVTLNAYFSVDVYMFSIFGIPFFAPMSNLGQATTAAFCSQELTVDVIAPDTGATIMQVTQVAPPGRNEIFVAPGTVSDDDTPPTVVNVILPTRLHGNVQDVTIAFSERMRATSFDRFAISDSRGYVVSGTIESLYGSTVLAFRPRTAFRLEEEYTVSLLGVTDLAGNQVQSDPISFTRAAPKSLSELQANATIFQEFARCTDAYLNSCYLSAQDMAYARNTLFIANGLRVPTESYLVERADPPRSPNRLGVVDMSNPKVPRLIGWHTTITDPRAVAVLTDVSFPYTTTGGVEIQFAGDLLVVIGGGRGGNDRARNAKLEIYDITPCMQRLAVVNCLDEPLLNDNGGWKYVALKSMKFLSTGIGEVQRIGVPPDPGVASELAVLHQRIEKNENGRTFRSDTAVAYAVVVPIGIVAVDIPKAFGNIDSTKPDRFAVDAVKRGSFFDVAVIKNGVMAVEEPSGGSPRLSIFAASLYPLDEISLPRAFRIAAGENLVFDVDGDGNLGVAEETDDDNRDDVVDANDRSATSEIFDLAVVASGGRSTVPGIRGELYVIDVSDLTDLEHTAPLSDTQNIDNKRIISQIPLPGSAFGVCVDREAQVAYVDIVRPWDTDYQGVAVVDLSHLLTVARGHALEPGLIDQDGDQIDDRILYIMRNRQNPLQNLKGQACAALTQDGDNAGLLYLNWENDGPEFLGSYTLEVDSPVFLKSDIDTINGRKCQAPAYINFRLSHPAEVTITIEGEVIRVAGHVVGSSQAEVEIRDWLFQAGPHSVPIPPDLVVNPGEHEFEVKAIFARGDPQQGVADLEEIAGGVIVHEVVARSAFPIGHTMVEGVDLWDGHLTHGSQDLMIPGRGLALEFSRSYSSAGITGDGPLGAGWSHNLDVRLVRDSCGRYVVIGGEGTGNTFVDPVTDPAKAILFTSALFTATNESLFYSSQIGYHSTLIRDGDNANVFDFFTKSHIRYHFEREGEIQGEVYTLRFIEEPNGNRLSFEYVAIDNDPTTLDLVTDSSGRALRLNYREIDRHKRIVQLVGEVTTNPVGLNSVPNIEINYEYDTVGNLVAVTRTTPYAGYDFNDQRVERYTYSSQDPIDPYNLLSYTDPNDNRTEYVYYATSDTIPGYTSDFLVPKPEFVKSIQKPEGVRTTFVYTISTNVNVPNLRAVSDPRPNVGPSIYTLNNYGAAVQIEDALGGTTSITWCTDLPLPAGCDRRDALKVAETDALGRTLRYRHDELGNVIEETIDLSTIAAPHILPVRDATGNPVTQITTRYTYDPLFSKMTSRIDAERNTTYFCLESPSTPPAGSPCLPVSEKTGNLLALVDAEGNRTEYVHASQTDVVGGNYGPGDVKTIVDARGFRIRYTRYDRYGNATEMVDAEGNINTSLYDARNHLVESYDTAEHHATYTYDGLDRLITTAHLDDRGEGGTPQVAVYRYTPNGELVTMTTGLRSENEYGRPDAGHTTVFAYDQLNRLVTQTERRVLQADGSRLDLGVQYVYDEASNVLHEVDARDITQSHVYDALSRRITSTLTGPSTPNDLVVFAATYDLLGNQLSETDLHGYITDYVYDALYRRVETRLPFAHSHDSVPLQQAVTNVVYDKVGNKLRETDANGHETRYEVYDRMYRLQKATDADGMSTLYTYDDAGNTIREEDQRSGLIVEYGYDGLSRVVAMTQTLPLTQPTFSTVTYVITYTYDDRDNAVVVTDPRGVKSRADKDGLDRIFQTIEDVDGLKLTTSYTYDAYGNEKTVSDAQNGDVDVIYDYDGIRRRIRTTYVASPDDQGQLVTEEFVYDGNGNLIRHTDKRKITYTYTYDNLNRELTEHMVESISNGGNELVLSETVYEDGTDQDGRYTDGDTGVYRTVTYDANRNQTITEYDSLGRPIKIDDPDPEGTAAYAYDSVNLRNETDKKGHFIRHTYDVLDRMILTEEFDRAPGQGGTLQSTLSAQYLDEQNLTVEIDRKGTETIKQTDGLGRLVQLRRKAADMTGPYGQVEVLLESYAYDGNGNATLLVDGQGNRTTYTYDGANRQTSMTEGAGTAVESTTVWTYDAVGNVLTVKDGRAHADVSTPNCPYATVFDLCYTYDARYRKASETNGAGETTHYSYDASDNIVTMTEPLGAAYTTVYRYDELDQLLAVDETPRGQDGTTAGVTRFVYDANRNTIAQQDAIGNLVTYQYDALDRLTDTFQHTAPGTVGDSTTRSDSLGGDEATALHWHYAYDVNDNQTLIVDAEGQQVESQYDYLDRLASKIYAAHTAPNLDFQVQAIAYAYDGNSNTIAVTETKTLGGSVIVEGTGYTYDPLDRVQSVTRRAHDDPEGKTISYDYDVQGNRTAVTDPDGATTTYTYDARNRLATVTTEAGTTAYQWWEDDLLKAVVYPNGTVQDRSLVDSYDRADRILKIVNGRVGPALPYSSYIYTYDANGNRLTQVETQQALGGQAQTTTYTYDTLNRLATVDYGVQGGVLYTYDAAGNRLTERGTDPHTGSALNRSYEYGALADRPGVTFDGVNALTHIIDHLTPAQSVIYEYDANLNLVSRLQNGQRDEYRYDIRDQMVAAVVDGIYTRFDYDAAGMRVVKIGDQGETRYLYDDDAVLVETDGAGQTQYKYDYGYELLALTTVGGASTPELRESQFYLTDALMSTANLADESGALVHSYRYDAWGAILNEEGSSPNPRQYTGHYHDDETGLDYFGARYYDSEIGRFLTQDPYLGEASTPPSLHRYLYAYANPLRYIDLTGYSSTEANRSGGVMTRAVQSGLRTNYEQSGYSLTTEPGTSYQGSDIWVNMEDPGSAGAMTSTGVPELDFFIGYASEMGKLAWGTVEELGNFGVDILTGLMVITIGDEETKANWESGAGLRSNISRSLAEGTFLSGTWEGIKGMPASWKASWDTMWTAAENGDYMAAGRALAGPVYDLLSFVEIGAGAVKAGVAAVRVVGRGTIAVTKTVTRAAIGTAKLARRGLVATAKAAARTAKVVGKAIMTTTKAAGLAIKAAGQSIVGATKKIIRTLTEACSFSAGTPVLTSEGAIAISQVEVGDRVLGYRETLHVTDFYTVTATLSHQDPVVVIVTIDNERIETTPEHPFYVASGEWIAAGNLQIGARIRKADGTYGSVQDVEVVQQPQTMYNLTVAEASTFFIGDQQWLVHNRGICARGLAIVGEDVRGWTARVDDALRRSKWGRYYEAGSRTLTQGYARRHIRSLNDMIAHYQGTLNKLSVGDAIQKLAANGIEVKGRTWTAVRKAVIKRLKQFNKDPMNLWVGKQAPNLRISTGLDYPPSWRPAEKAAHTIHMRRYYLLK